MRDERSPCGLRWLEASVPGPRFLVRTISARSDGHRRESTTEARASPLWCRHVHGCKDRITVAVVAVRTPGVFGEGVIERPVDAVVGGRDRRARSTHVLETEREVGRPR